jgi:hypothetical protein
MIDICNIIPIDDRWTLDLDALAYGFLANSLCTRIRASDHHRACYARRTDKITAQCRTSYNIPHTSSSNLMEDLCRERDRDLSLVFRGRPPKLLSD